MCRVIPYVLLPLLLWWEEGMVRLISAIKLFDLAMSNAIKESDN